MTRASIDRLRRQGHASLAIGAMLAAILTGIFGCSPSSSTTATPSSTANVKPASTPDTNMAAPATTSVAAALQDTMPHTSTAFQPGNAARGETIAKTCAACHGAAVMKVGTPPIEPPRLLHERASYVYYALRDYKTGRRKSDVMQPMADALDDQQMRDVAAYLASKPLGPPQAEMVGTPAYKFTLAHCTLCHGETGMGEMEGMPILTGQNKDYLKRALEEYQSGVRVDQTMRAVAKSLTPAEIDEVATYFSTQKALERLQ